MDEARRLCVRRRRIAMGNGTYHGHGILKHVNHRNRRVGKACIW